MSRMTYALIGAVLLAACLGGVAHAQQASAPPFATTKVDGTDNVYIFRNGGHQSMFVVTSAGVIATDPIAYARPQGGATYVSEIKKVTSHPGVPGGRLGTKQDVQSFLTFLQDASAAVKAEAQAGKCWDGVEKGLKLPKYESWAGYENNLPFVLRRYCGLWGRGT